MEKTTKILLVIIVLLVIVNALFFIKTTGNIVKNADKPVVKIGVIVPLSGESSFMGVGYQRAIALAKEKLKDTKYDYELIYEDSKGFDSKETSSAVQKLINADNVDAIFTLSSGTGNIVSPLTEENKIIHIGYASDPNVAKGRYNFLHATTPQAENKVFIEELQNKGIKKIAIISMNQEGAIVIDNDLKERIKSTDIQIVSDQKFNLGTKDFKTILMKAKESNPDIYLLHTFSPDLEILAKQAKELGITKLTSIEAFDFTSQPELFEGLWYVTQAVGTDEFRMEYESKYNEEPPIASPNAYDKFNLIVTAYEKAGKNLANEKPSHEKVAEELEGIKGFNGAVGELNVLSNHIIDSKAAVREIHNGKPVTIGGG